MTAFVENAKNKYNEFYDYVKDNKGKMAVAVGSTIAVFSFAAAYLAFPAYGVKVAALTASAIAAISVGFASAFTFATTNPIAFGLLAIAAVGAIGILAVKSYNQASQLGEVRDLFVDRNSASVIQGDPEKVLTQIKEVLNIEGPAKGQERV
ncbi:Hypothetical protein CINCED_3A018019 [Cinara cedri]|uniref:Uncharacterized protein n=1 Tax=Cinara cedri TaxID=506608 RepID=A0A5E4NND5_9HEMI|nr:Hypothetical protein CINCED_3A018019 [Cinara cedri]